MTCLKSLPTLFVLAITGCGEPGPEYNQPTETIARGYTSPALDKSARGNEMQAPMSSAAGHG